MKKLLYIILILFFVNICFATDPNLVAEYPMNDNADSNIIVNTKGGNGRLYGSPANWLGNYVINDDCNNASLWTIDHGALSNDTVNTIWGGSSVKMTCSNTHANDYTFISKAITQSIVGCHFAIKLDILPGTIREPNSYLNLSQIQLVLLDSSGKPDGLAVNYLLVNKSLQNNSAR